MFTLTICTNQQITTWIPSYEASRALLEMRNSSESVLHLVHPHPLPWTTLIQFFARELNLPLIPYPDWIAALQGKLLEGQVLNVDEMRANPALRLLDFFRPADTRPGREAIGLARLDVKKSVQVAPSLLNVPQVDEQNVKAWLAAWRASGFLPSVGST